MVDYLEQLLRQAADGTEDEEPEEGEALPLDLPPGPAAAAGPAAGPEEEGTPAGAERPPAGPEGPAPEDPGGPDWRELGQNRPVPPPPAQPEAAPGGVAEELLGGMETALPPAGEGGWIGAGDPAPTLPPLSAPSGQALEAESGLHALYRGVRAETWSGSAAQKAGVAVVRESALPEGTGLTMGQLDRAVRRDSRRYDGGMSIY